MASSFALDVHDFHNLRVKPRHMHFIDEPHGFSDGLFKGNLAHQMRYSVELLERELQQAGMPHVLQLVLKGEDERNPDSWGLFVDGIVVAKGTGDFARECFFNNKRAFLGVCRDAVSAAKLSQWDEHEYSLLCAARRIAAVG